jgi:hypothetical protein
MKTATVLTSFTVMAMHIVRVNDYTIVADGTELKFPANTYVDFK